MRQELAEFGLNEREEKFVSALARGKTPKDAARAAGYGNGSIESVSSRLLHKPHIQLAVHVETRRRLIGLAPLAISVLETLAKSAKTEKIKLEAANSILNRAGLIAPRAAADKSPVDTPLHEMSVAQLRTMADRLEGELAARATPVNAPSGAQPSEAPIDIVG